jgi:hypothetical protein
MDLNFLLFTKRSILNLGLLLGCFLSLRRSYPLSCSAQILYSTVFTHVGSSPHKSFFPHLHYAYGYSTLPLPFPLLKRDLSGGRNNRAALILWESRTTTRRSDAVQTDSVFLCVVPNVLWSTPNSLPMSANGAGESHSARRIQKVE